MKALKTLVALAVLIASLSLVIAGQMHDGPLWLCAMLLGLLRRAVPECRISNRTGYA